jgi:hypothetical protein
MAATTRPRIRIAAEPQQRGFTSKAADVFSFILGFATLFSVHFIGELYLAEILLATVLPILLIMRGKRAFRPELKFVYILMSTWLAGLVLADAYNHTPLTDRMRGVALIVFFGTNLLGISVLIGRNQRRKVLFFIGLMIGALVSVKLHPFAATQQYPWKFGYAWGTMQLVMLVSSYYYGRRRYVLSALLVLGICGVNVIENFRSPILQLLITMALVYPFIPEQVGGIRILPQSQGWRLLVLAILALGAAGASDELVKFVTAAGYIGEDAQAKNEAQAKGGNLLLGGRPEFAIGIQAALDRPIVGHGSWPKDLKYFEMLYDTMVENGAVGYDRNFDLEADGMIPSHSHIVSAWVWAGIAGLVFWAYMLWFVVQGIMQVAVQRPSLAPFYMWFFLSFFWDIWFSPFAANRRVIEAALIVVIADAIEIRLESSRAPWRRIGAVRHGILRPNGTTPLSPTGF